MINKPIYTFHVDYKDCRVLDEDFSSFMDKCFKIGGPFDVAITDKSGNGFTTLNAAINFFIDDCRKEINDRCLANPYRSDHFGDILKDFIEHYLLYYWKKITLLNSDDYYKFEIFKGNFSCTTFIPTSLISKGIFENYEQLGSDYLMGAKGMNSDVLFHYILPAYYFNLIYNDLTKNEDLLRLQDYRIGIK